MDKQKQTDLFFLSLAKKISHKSKDPSSKVGCVIVDKDNRIVSMGYNGFACGVKDDEERLANRDIKLKLTIHAEVNAIIFAARPLENCSIYLYPFFPCSPCGAVICNAKLAKVVSLADIPERWSDSIGWGFQQFFESGIEVVKYNNMEFENYDVNF